MNYRHSFILARPLFIAFLSILMSAILFTGYVYAASDTSLALSSPVEITEGWEYRIGDSPMDENGLPKWVYINSPDWKPFKYPGPPQDVKGQHLLQGEHIIWLRVKLPSNATFRMPYFFLKSPHQHFEAYIENTLVYTSGSIDPTGKIKSYNRACYRIPLPLKFQDKYLYLRLYSYSSSYLGILEDATLDNISNFVLALIRKYIDQIILAFLFVSAGLMSMLFFFIRKMEDKSLFSLSILSIALGLSTLCGSQINYLFNAVSPTFWFYLSTICTFLITICMVAFVEQSFYAGNKPIYRWLWQGFILYGILIFILDTTGLVSLLHSIRLFYLMALFTIPVIFYVFIKASKKDGINGVIATIGVMSAYASGFYDLLGNAIKLFPLSHSTFPLGMCIFIFSLVAITSRRFIGVYDKLKIYSEEIEVKNTTINEKNAKLEERTLELEVKNGELTVLLEQVQETQTQLIQSEKMAALGSLVAGVAHEINTPLGISITATSFLQQQIKESFDLYSSGKMKKSDLENSFAALAETATMVMCNMQKTSDFVKSFKQVAVDQSCEEKRKFNIKHYIEEVLLSLRPKLKKIHHSITLNCADDIVLYSYPGTISQIITNLIMNSLIHAYDDGDKGKIIIDIAVTNGNLRLTYSDDGKGIDSKIIDKIFDPFFTTKRGNGGTGLGLNIIYNIVTQTLYGSIKCESELGKGTTFVIEFPLNGKIPYDQ